MANRESLRVLIEGRSDREVMGLFLDALNGDKPVLKTTDVSIRTVFEACGMRFSENYGPTAGRLNHLMNGGSLLHEEDGSGAVRTNLFQNITGELIAREIIDGYNENQDSYIGDRLCRTMPGRIRNNRVAGFTALAGPLTVDEGQEYDKSTFEEKYVTTNESKKGRLVEVTEELVFFDQTGQILDRAREVGDMTAQERERTIVRGAIDADSNVYKPSGTAEALYSGANNNFSGSGSGKAAPYDAAIALADWTDLDLIETYHATLVTDDRMTPETQQPINWVPRILLTSRKLHNVANRIVSATEVLSLTGSDTERTRMSNPYNQLVALSSPFVDQVNGDDWFLGDFQRQFRWHEIWPLQTFILGDTNQRRHDADVLVSIKARYYGGIFAKDERWVIKVDGA